MTPELHEISELQREWRSSVTASIKSTEAKVDLMLSQMSEMRMEYVRCHHFEKLATRVSGLESDKQKIIGAAVLLNALGALVLFLISKFWK
jgi:hypothetical protein